MEGTRHRRDKGRRATDGPVEVIGATPFRTRVKRRKASMPGKSALSDEAQFPSVTWAYWRRDGVEVVVFYPPRSAGFRESGSSEDERTEDDDPAEVR